MVVAQSFWRIFSLAPSRARPGVIFLDVIVSQNDARGRGGRRWKESNISDPVKGLDSPGNLGGVEQKIAIITAVDIVSHDASKTCEGMTTCYL